MTDISVDTLSSSSIELEHAIGFTGRHALTLTHFQDDSIVYAIGKLLIFGNIKDPHNQVILRGHSAEITCVNISSSRRFLCSGQVEHSSDKEGSAPVIIWDVKRKEIIHNLPGHKGGVASCAFSADERWVASSGLDGKICVWEMESGQLAGSGKVATAKSSENSFAKWIQWIPMEQLAMSANGLSSLPMGNQSNSRQQRSQNQYYFIAGFEKELHLCSWSFVVRAMTYSLVQSVFQVSPSGGGLVRYYNCGCLGSDGLYCFGGTTSGDVVVYSVKSALYRIAIPVTPNIMSIVSVPDPLALQQDTLVVGGIDGTLKMITGREKDWKLLYETKLTGGITNISFVSDDQKQSQHILVGTNAGVVYLVSLPDFKECKIISQSHIASVRGISFPHGVAHSDTFATCGEDGWVRLWDLSDYRQRFVFNASMYHHFNYSSVPVPPNLKNRMASVRAPMPPVPATPLQTTAVGGTGGVGRSPQEASALYPTCLAFTVDDMALLVGYSDGSVRCLHVAKYLSQPNGGAAVALEGDIVEASMRDNPLAWVISAHKASITDLVVSSSYFCTAGEEGTVRVWSLRVKVSGGTPVISTPTIPNGSSGAGAGAAAGGVAAPLTYSAELLYQIQDHKSVQGVLVDITQDGILHSIGALDGTLHSYDLYHSELAKSAKRLVSHHIGVGSTNSGSGSGNGNGGPRGRGRGVGSSGGNSQINQLGFGMNTGDGRSITGGAPPGSNLLGMTQRHDHEREVITSTTDGQLLFFDMDYSAPTLAVRIPSSGNGSGGNSSSAAAAAAAAAASAVVPSGSAAQHVLRKPPLPVAVVPPTKDVPRVVENYGGAGSLRIPSVVVSPKTGWFLACVTSGGTLLIYDLRGDPQQPPRLLGQCTCHASEAVCVRWSPDERQLLTCATDGSLCVWNCYLTTSHGNGNDNGNVGGGHPQP